MAVEYRVDVNADIDFNEYLTEVTTANSERFYRYIMPLNDEFFFALDSTASHWRTNASLTSRKDSPVWTILQRKGTELVPLFKSSVPIFLGSGFPYNRYEVADIRVIDVIRLPRSDFTDGDKDVKPVFVIAQAVGQEFIVDDGQYVPIRSDLIGFELRPYVRNAVPEGTDPAGIIHYGWQMLAADPQDSIYYWGAECRAVELSATEVGFAANAVRQSTDPFAARRSDHWEVGKVTRPALAGPGTQGWLASTTGATVTRNNVRSQRNNDAFVEPYRLMRFDDHRFLCFVDDALEYGFGLSRYRAMVFDSTTNPMTLLADEYCYFYNQFGTFNDIVVERVEHAHQQVNGVIRTYGNKIDDGPFNVPDTLITNGVGFDYGIWEHIWHLDVAAASPLTVEGGMRRVSVENMQAASVNAQFRKPSFWYARSPDSGDVSILISDETDYGLFLVRVNQAGSQIDPPIFLRSLKGQYPLERTKFTGAWTTTRLHALTADILLLENWYSEYGQGPSPDQRFQQSISVVKRVETGTALVRPGRVYFDHV